MGLGVEFLIVDDHATVREGLVRLLSAQFTGSHFTSVSTAAEALVAWDVQTSGIIVLDLNLLGRDGLSLIGSLKDRQKGSRLLVHTMYPEDQFGIRALRAGADGYLTKDRPVPELFEAIGRLIEGKRFISDFLVSLMADAMTGNHPEIERAESLSDREYEVLRLLSSGKSMSIIAQELDLSIKTVSTYRTRMLEKLGLRTTAELIRFGILSKPPSSI
jgi:two-component system, NarL family, invasion response regulator UvrY